MAMRKKKITTRMEIETTFCVIIFLMINALQLFYIIRPRVKEDLLELIESIFKEKFLENELKYFKKHIYQ